MTEAAKDKTAQAGPGGETGAADRATAPGPARLEVLGDVAVLLIDNPPVNALGHALRQAIADRLTEAEADPAVRAVMLLAEGRSFPAGADITEFGKPPRAPLLPDLCNRIEACAKPVIAALHGTALGGGLELALAAHHRIALASARLGLPEVTLGLLPGAGGTQRLPRLVGVEAALRLMLSGKPVGAAEAQSLGLVDRLCDTDLPGAAYAFALEVVDAIASVQTRDRREGLRYMGAGIAAVARARNAVKDQPIAAPGRIVDCVEAAMLLPFEQGLSFERAAFLDLVDTPEASALRHVFFAGRRAATLPGGKGQSARLAHVAVLGADRASLRLVTLALGAGLRVSLADHDAAALSETLEAVATGLEEDKAAGRLTAAQAADRWARLQPELPDALPGGIDLLFLCAGFGTPGTTLPELPATLPVLGFGRAGPGRGPGVILHPAGPEPARLAEMLSGPGQRTPVIAALADWFKAQGLAIVQGHGTSILRPMAQALHLAVDELRRSRGDAVAQDRLRLWGFLPGPEGRSEATGGFDAFSGGDGAALLGAMANAGLRSLGEGAALRPGDLDIAAIAGLGLPRWSGGPMFWAGRRGLLVLREDLRRWAARDPDIWTPAPLLDQMLREGVSLAELDLA
ncbi:MAG: enoyl-CoA hydratase-related protein [Pseudorhodobacter sp.]